MFKFICVWIQMEEPYNELVTASETTRRKKNLWNKQKKKITTTTTTTLENKLFPLDNDYKNTGIHFNMFACFFFSSPSVYLFTWWPLQRPHWINLSSLHFRLRYVYLLHFWMRCMWYVCCFQSQGIRTRIICDEASRERRRHRLP